MEIRRHPDCTLDIGAPSDIKDGSCLPLPVEVIADRYGRWARSFWKPDEFELAALNAGGAVVLEVRADGRQHPVVAVRTTPDKTEPL